MKSYILILTAFLAVIFLSSFSTKNNSTKLYTRTTVDGKGIFISNGCTACHTNSENSIGPKISIIAKAYKGKKEQLVKFLKREAKPIVAPEEFAMMNAFLLNTQKMSDKERSLIASYILSSN